MTSLAELLLPAETAGMRVQIWEDEARVALPCSPLALMLWLDEGRLKAAMYCRTSSSEWTGERTDLNDIYSSFASAALASAGLASTRFLQVDHPAVDVPGEIYARFLWLEQPSRGSYPAEAEAVGALLEGLAVIEDVVHRALPCSAEISSDHPARSAYAGSGGAAAEWASTAAAALGRSQDPESDVVALRPLLRWRYYRSKQGVVLENVAATAALRDIAMNSSATFVEAPGSRLVINGNLRNCIPTSALSQAVTALRTLEPTTPHQPVAVATDDQLAIAGTAHVVLLPTDSGRARFEMGRRSVRERHRAEAAALFPPAAFQWSPRVDGGRFEDLIHDLLLREPGVRRVRRTGGSNDRDGGRDLIVEWEMPRAGASALTETDQPSVLRRVVVQCKAHARNVGPSTVAGPGPLDVMYRYNADGYLLVVTRQITSALVDYLDHMRLRGDYFVEWWTRTELEDRLAGTADLVAAYADLLDNTSSGC